MDNARTLNRLHSRLTKWSLRRGQGHGRAALITQSDGCPTLSTPTLSGPPPPIRPFRWLVAPEPTFGDEGRTRTLARHHCVR